MRFPRCSWSSSCCSRSPSLFDRAAHESSRRRDHPRRPLTPPDGRFHIQRFMKNTGAVASYRAATPGPDDLKKHFRKAARAIVPQRPALIEDRAKCPHRRRPRPHPVSGLGEPRSAFHCRHGMQRSLRLSQPIQPAAFEAEAGILAPPSLPSLGTAVMDAQRFLNIAFICP